MRSLKKNIFNILFIFGFTILIGLGFSLYFGGKSKLTFWSGILQNIIYSVLLGGSLWIGNKKLANYFNKRYSWLEHTTWIVIRHTVILLIYSTVIITLFYLYIWFAKMHKTNLHNFFDHFKVSFFVFFTITAIITLFYYSRGFFLSWKNSVINEARLKRESIALQYEALKNQVNPHFLFNSLNVLTSLIEKDPKASITYVKQLSEVFRYVLDQNSAELVLISDELKFMESFVYLQKIRFGDNLKIKVQVTDNNFKIVPVALQILLENAIKHNEISTENPLLVEIYDDEKYLIVKNKLQPRNYLPESNHLGLKSLQFQYQFLSNTLLDILCKDENFTVKLPKIKDQI